MFKVNNKNTRMTSLTSLEFNVLLVDDLMFLRTDFQVICFNVSAFLEVKKIS